MRVVSLVPSLTETLLECGVEVVGRTRFCVHPLSAHAIPVVGGTKDLDLSLVEGLKPDLLLLDKEENLPWMAEARAWKVHCTHVESVGDMPREVEVLGALLGNTELRRQAEEWGAVLSAPRKNGRVEELPGVLEWIQKPAQEPAQILYMIWRNPWMAVAKNTFVGSMLAHAGYGERIPEFAEKYPKLDLGAYDPARTLLLFSSEPFPFVKKKKELQGLGFPCALVDGEVYSWFGVRSLRFLQKSFQE